MEANKCPNCGASINNESDRITTCTYCGGTIINDAVDKTIKKEEPIKPQTSSSYTSIQPEHPGSAINLKLKFKVPVFVLLLFFMWPVALIYLFICKAQEKEDKNKK